MQQGPVVVLSRFGQVVSKVRSVLREARVSAVSCLDDARAGDRNSTLLIDPGTIEPCCLKRLVEWSGQRPLRRVIYLCLPGPPEVLFSLPQLHPGAVKALRDVETLLGGRSRRTPARSAWQKIGRLLSEDGRDDCRRRFLTLARVPHRRVLTAAGAAGSLDLGVRHLSRLVQAWFGYPPRIVFGFFRIECLARDLRMTGLRLGDIASRHGYPSPQVMSRQFRAYTGLTPGAYRFKTRTGDK